MLDIQENINLKPFFTMKIGGQAKYFCIVKNQNQLIEAAQFARSKGIGIFPIGSGSNTVITDNKNSNFLKENLFIYIQTKGISKIHEDNNLVILKSAAGENWDQFVEYSIKNNLRGLENLSHIPGTVGAGPIQNIGAYGTEVSETVAKVEILNIDDMEFYEISSQDCQFSYRHSIFKENIGKFIITNVYFNLEKGTKNLPIPEYKDTQLFFLAKNKKTASAKEIRQAIIEIRNKKIPWPDKIPNSGSFFQNPIVDIKLAQKIIVNYPEAPYFKIGCEQSENKVNQKVKLFAGWLIEKSMKSRKITENFEVTKNNYLVLSNIDGQGNFEELQDAIRRIKKAVSNKFRIELEVEPNILE